MDEGTSLNVTYGDLGISVETSAGWTPELIEHTLVRMRRQLVAAARQLGVTPTLAEVEGE